MTLTDILICPLCGGELTKNADVFRCAAGHSYDAARSGYVNLLPPGKGRNKKTGDERPSSPITPKNSSSKGRNTAVMPKSAK